MTVIIDVLPRVRQDGKQRLLNLYLSSNVLGISINTTPHFKPYKHLFKKN